jgi:hypothetical protein
MRVACPGDAAIAGVLTERCPHGRPPGNHGKPADEKFDAAGQLTRTTARPIV